MESLVNHGGVLELEYGVHARIEPSEILPTRLRATCTDMYVSRDSV